MLRVLFTTLALAAAACAGTTRPATQDVPPGLAARSARLVDCPPEAIQIGDVDWRAGDDDPTGWIATCRGTTFYCSTLGAGSCTLVAGP